VAIQGLAGRATFPWIGAETRGSAPCNSEGGDPEAGPVRSGLLRLVKQSAFPEQEPRSARADERGDDEKPELRDRAWI
jgi:hypothetical protein